MTDRSVTKLMVEVDGSAPLEVASGDAVLVDHQVAEALAVPGRTLVRLDGRDVSSWSIERRARAGLVVLGQVQVAGEVSIRDHLVAVPGVTAAQVDGLLVQAPLLAGRGADPAGWLSGGERQVLGWLQTLLLGPRVVVLDVAGRGLDGPTLRWAGEQVRGWAATGGIVLVHAGRPEEEAWLEAPG